MERAGEPPPKEGEHARSAYIDRTYNVLFGLLGREILYGELECIVRDVGFVPEDYDSIGRYVLSSATVALVLVLRLEHGSDRSVCRLVDFTLE